ncbi:MAG: DUF302 domain-containing protein [Brumimicrobium sp.]|nr:DUF302 domain-containing protein [Brumimicrobium sp.]MCO5269239.1 DUF302 domain-containing protein [Brumimicrobium sp.]
MSYYFSKTISGDFDTAVEKVTEKLKENGFGVLTEIDMQTTLKKKLDVDIRKYKILGACNPPFAYKAFQSEEHIGLMLPCNVLVQENDKDEIVVSAIDPVASMMAIKNDELGTVANEVREKLKTTIENL